MRLIMSPLEFFIENFVAKNRQERWQFLINGKWEKFARKIKELDTHLNNNCIKIENNAYEKFNDIIKEYTIRSGYYYDAYSNELEMSPISLDNIHNDSLLICPQKKIAFFFSS